MFLTSERVELKHKTFRKASNGFALVLALVGLYKQSQIGTEEGRTFSFNRVWNHNLSISESFLCIAELVLVFLSLWDRLDQCNKHIRASSVDMAHNRQVGE